MFRPPSSSSAALHIRRFEVPIFGYGPEPLGVNQFIDLSNAQGQRLRYVNVPIVEPVPIIRDEQFYVVVAPPELVTELSVLSRADAPLLAAAGCGSRLVYPAAPLPSRPRFHVVKR